MVGMERRTDPRARVSLLGTVHTEDGERPVVVLDLSTGGARIQAGKEPDMERDYHLDFRVHDQEYKARFRVVRWDGAEETYQWGCSFADLSSDQMNMLRRSVHAAVGLSETFLRPWDEIEAEAKAPAGAYVIVGHTPAGREILLAAKDCLDIGSEGVELFVRTLASLERT